jgi:membrane dipeptidase
MGKQPRSNPYPAIDSHVDLLYDLIRRHPEIPLQELPDAWVSLPKLAEGGVRVIVSDICWNTPRSTCRVC